MIIFRLHDTCKFYIDEPSYVPSKTYQYRFNYNYNLSITANKFPKLLFNLFIEGKTFLILNITLL